MALIAVEGCTFKFTPQSLTPQLTTVTIQTQASTKDKCEHKGIYTTPLQFTVSGYTGGSITDSGTGVTTKIEEIKASVQYTKADGKLVIVKGDKVSISLQGTSGSGESTVIQEVLIEVDDAGQNTVNAK